MRTVSGVLMLLCFFKKYFLGLLLALLIEQLEIDRKQDERQGE